MFVLDDSTWDLLVGPLELLRAKTGVWIDLDRKTRITPGHARVLLDAIRVERPSSTDEHVGMQIDHLEQLLALAIRSERSLVVDCD